MGYSNLIFFRQILDGLWVIESTRDRVFLSDCAHWRIEIECGPRRLSFDGFPQFSFGWSATAQMPEYFLIGHLWSLNYEREKNEFTLPHTHAHTHTRTRTHTQSHSTLSLANNQTNIMIDLRNIPTNMLALIIGFGHSSVIGGSLREMTSIQNGRSTINSIAFIHRHDVVGHIAVGFSSWQLLSQWTLNRHVGGDDAMGVVVGRFENSPKASWLNQSKWNSKHHVYSTRTKTERPEYLARVTAVPIDLANNAHHTTANTDTSSSRQNVSNKRTKSITNHLIQLTSEVVGAFWVLWCGRKMNKINCEESPNELNHFVTCDLDH